MGRLAEMQRKLLEVSVLNIQILLLFMQRCSK